MSVLIVMKWSIALSASKRGMTIDSNQISLPLLERSQNSPRHVLPAQTVVHISSMNSGVCRPELNRS